MKFSEREKRMLTWTVLLVALFVLLTGCSKEIIISSGDLAQVEIANVTILFSFKDQVITCYNDNKEWAEVEIRRWNSDTQSYLKIFHEGVCGYGEISREASFEHGDDIKIRVKIEGQEIIRYYILG
ncbi:MAG: hypothetical protein ACP5IX_00800 [Patescibacteria group bacterium]